MSRPARSGPQRPTPEELAVSKMVRAIEDPAAEAERRFPSLVWSVVVHRNLAGIPIAADVVGKFKDEAGVDRGLAHRFSFEDRPLSERQLSKAEIDEGRARVARGFLTSHEHRKRAGRQPRPEHERFKKQEG